MAILALFLLTLLSETAAVTYTVQTRTSYIKWSGTDNIDATLSLTGTDGSVELGILDNVDINDLEEAATDTFTFESDVDIGDFRCAQFDVGDDDAWLMDWISVSVGSAEARYIYNENTTWLSSDPTEGVDELNLCVAGSETYYIVIETANHTWAGSDKIHLKVAIEGSKGTSRTGFLDNPDKDDFIIGENDVFIVPDLALAGKVQCLTLTALGDDLLIFDWIVVFSLKSHKLPPRVFWNEDETRLSSDLTEGVSEMRVCYKASLEDDRRR